MIDFVVVAFQDRLAVTNLLADIEATVHVPHTITVIDNTLRNRGWALGCNLGAALGESDLIGFVNPDVDLTSGWLQPVLRALHQDPRLIVAGPRCLDNLTWPRKGTGMNGWVCGACMVIRRWWFDTHQGFDHQAFPHEYAETNLERQVEHEGLKVRTIEEATVTHRFVSDKSSQVLAWRRQGELSEQQRWEVLPA